MLALRNRNGTPFALMNEDFDRVFSKFFEGVGSGQRVTAGGGSFPAMNVVEEEAQLVIEAEVPGLSMEDLELNILDNTLTVTGEKKEVKEVKGKVHWKETRSGKFSRVLRIPFAVDAQKTSAELKDGILRITVPKQEVAKPKKIEVKIGS